LTCRVSGATAAWLDTIEHLGSGKVSIKDIFTPAIDLAEKGYE
jgi:gamma-glutamyltranspeptidase / glutathione hydrolase